MNAIPRKMQKYASCTKEEQWADKYIQHPRRLSQAFWEGCSFKDEEVESISKFLFSLAVYSQSS